MPLKDVINAVIAKGRRVDSNLADIQALAERALAVLMEENKNLEIAEFDFDMAYCVFFVFTDEALEANGGIDELHEAAMQQFDKIFDQMAAEELPHLLDIETLARTKYKALIKTIANVRDLQNNLADAMKVDALEKKVMSREWITEKEALQYFFLKCDEQGINY